MSETLETSADNLAVSSDEDRRLFYVVSKRKLAILLIGTMGLYLVYWFYKNWDQYRDNIPYGSEDANIWPVMRAIFSIFFVHSLLRKIKDSAKDLPRFAQWSSNAHAWQMILLLLLANGLDRVAGRGIGLPVTGILSLLILLPLLATFGKAQTVINLSCGDADGKSNDKLTGANWAWLVLGALLWIGSILDLFSVFISEPAKFAGSSSW